MSNFDEDSCSSLDTEEAILLDDDDDFLLLVGSLSERSMSAHPINTRRPEFGEFHHLYPDLRRDDSKFFEYMRLHASTFDYICDMVRPKLTKKLCNLHSRPIKTEERVMLTPRYLSTGLSFRALSYSFRMGASTVSKIVAETVSAIWNTFQQKHMPVPQEEDFIKIAEEYYRLWNFPNCVGTIDGKHVRVLCPDNSGSMFYNYKYYFSIVLQGVVDANYRFICIDVGGYGKQSDGGTFRASTFFKRLQEGSLHFPPSRQLPRSQLKLPHVLLGDDAYPLLDNLSKPYKGDHISPDAEYFNARLSRARRTVECAFDILYAKWRILGKAIETNVTLADKIVKTICVLHNLIIDREGVSHNLRDITLVPSATTSTGGRNSASALLIRDIFKMYVCSHPIMNGVDV